MNKDWLIVGLAVAVAIFATLYFMAPAPQPPVGAFPGPDILADRISLNGVGLLPHSSPLNQASTTLCSVRPRATSTLLLSRLNINTATTVAIAVEIGKSTLPDATTTRLAYRLFTASEKGVLGRSQNGLRRYGRTPRKIHRRISTDPGVISWNS